MTNFHISVDKNSNIKVYNGDIYSYHFYVIY